MPHLTKYRPIILSFICSAVTTVSFYMKSGGGKLSESVKASPLYEFTLYKLINHITGSVGTLNFFSLLIFAAIFYFFLKRPGYKGSRTQKLFAYLFSLFVPFILLLCESYNTVSSWDMVFGSKSAVLISVIKIIGFSFPVYTVFCFLSNVEYSPVALKGNYKKSSFKNDLIKYTALFFVCWLPYIILLYPGCFSPDSRDEIAQIFNNREFCWSQGSIVLLDDSVILNNHHPVFYTGILKVFTKLGKAISSYGISFEILCMLQAVILALSFAYAIAVMKKHSCKKSFTVCSAVFFALNPLFPIYAMTILKDTLFCALFVLTVVQLYEIAVAETITAKRLIAFFFTLILFMLIRNNSFYILLAVLILLIIILFKEKKRMLKVGSVVLAALLVFQIGFVSVLYPALSITPGSKREMLSVPFVQTARYIKEHGDEISAEDEEAILKVLNNGGTLEEIAKVYNPVLSDSVKNKFNKYADKEDLVKYFKVWLKGLKAHPATYVQAYLNLHYGWFCLEKEDSIPLAYSMVSVNMRVVIEDFSDNMGNSAFRSAVNTFLELIDSNPVSKAFIRTASYSWIYVFLLFYSLKHKRFKALLANSVVFLNYLICFAGPIAYMRYAIPMVCIVPFSIFITLKKDKTE